MSKYCCFFCPSTDYSEKSLMDVCPSCGRTYGFVLDKIPDKIGEFKVVSSLGRGFYGATYIAEKGILKRKYVLKVSPIIFYEYFPNKSFEQETELHNRLAENANHIIGIDDCFRETIEFSDAARTQLECYVTVLEYVKGSLLHDYLDGTIQNIKAATICQIAIDLLNIRSEFEANELNHNDFHDENLIIECLPSNIRRPDAIDDTIRVKAIDLGSISDLSKSSDKREGDLTFIAKHVDKLLSTLLNNPDSVEDREYRVALELQTIVNGLRLEAQNFRRPSSTDFIEKIREAYYSNPARRPWLYPMTLRAFGDHYNAQTLESWNVPQLLVDPNNEWHSGVMKSGPQIITGMRGCGKTMLLRALDIHARLTGVNNETAEQIITRVKEDGYIGLFVSAQRLLDLREDSLLKLENRLTRLFVCYALQAVRALLHLRDIKNDTLNPQAHSLLSNAIADYLIGCERLRNITSLIDLERQLERILVSTLRNSDNYCMNGVPATVFPHFAEKLRACSDIFSSSIVFFLLDDVSTRYLDLDKINNILSATLFQSPICAFKFTSEWQTVELGLKSPGKQHPIREGRDLDVFDLGERVYETIKADGKEKGKEFVAKILRQRAAFHSSDFQKIDPIKLLGDVPLEAIANEIASSSSKSEKRKYIYRGISCLTNVCVGDIGDVIKLYEEILRRANKGALPVPNKIQSECFQTLSSHRLYDLNRLDNRFKNHALAFAEAAHDLLVRSGRINKNSSEHEQKPRLRQYTSVYVKISSDDEESAISQIDAIRELIDAGVFVNTGSGGAPRLKNKGSSPTRQFKLSFRKIYGLASLIGLADRDRFELSGEELNEWLTKTSNAKEVLIRNQIKSESDIFEIAEEHKECEDSLISNDAYNQEIKLETTNEAPMTLFDLLDKGAVSSKLQNKKELLYNEISFKVNNVKLNELPDLQIKGIIGGLGFEDRALESNIELSKYIEPREVHFVRYPIDGHTKEIFERWSRFGTSISEHMYNEAIVKLPSIDGLALIDISGLTKPLIFQAIKKELEEKRRVLVCHVTAKEYYPLKEDIEKVFAAAKSEEPSMLLESLASILKGETGEYTAMKLIQGEADPLRDRALVAFASAKHERLFTLLDRRDYNFIEILTPPGNEPWKRVAQLAANFLCSNYQNATISNYGARDLTELVKYLDKRYLEIYSSGANFEIGLTGSKMQAAAAAIISSSRKVAQTWYLSPKKFDETRFSSGVGELRIYDIQI